MEKWTDHDNESLLRFKDDLDSDEIRIKERIKQKVLGSRAILHLLNNSELERQATTEPEDYYGVNIFPAYIIPDIQSKVSNFLCYDIMCDTQAHYNKTRKKVQMTFYVLSHAKNLIEKKTGIARTDLIGALLQDIFNYEHSDMFGERPMLVSNLPGVTDNNYCTRTLIFEAYMDNNIIKTRNGIPYMANKGLPIGAE